MGDKNGGKSTGYNGPPVVQTGLEGGFGINIPDPNASAAPAFEMPSFEMPDFGAQQADYAKQIQQQEQERLKTQGLNDRDTLYSDYLSAAGSATDYISGEIKNERSNARLLGIDYDITDDQKSERISNYFASIWGEGDQSRLEGLFKQWGNPGGFEEFAVARGDASSYADSVKGSESSKARSGGQKPRKTLASKEEDTTLGQSKTVLGG